jgi:hypothetical protein
LLTAMGMLFGHMRSILVKRRIQSVNSKNKR